MRNFVVKNDFNRAMTHKDKKNDYSREWDIEEEIEEYENERRTSGVAEEGGSNESKESK